MAQAGAPEDRRSKGRVARDIRRAQVPHAGGQRGRPCEPVAWGDAHSRAVGQVRRRTRALGPRNRGPVPCVPRAGARCNWSWRDSAMGDALRRARRPHASVLQEVHAEQRGGSDVQVSAARRLGGRVRPSRSERGGDVLPRPALPPPPVAPNRKSLGSWRIQACFDFKPVSIVNSVVGLTAKRWHRRSRAQKGGIGEWHEKSTRV